VSRNQARGANSVALFEVGSVFRLVDGDVEERPKLAFALAGAASDGWAEDERALDFFDAKGALQALLDGLGVRAWSLGEPPGGQLLHPGRSARVVIDGRPSGIVGELHPRSAERLELVGRIAIAELEVASLRAAGDLEVTLEPVPRYPPVRRDLAFVVDDSAAAADVREAIVAAGGALLGEARLFDVYRGEAIPSGRKSLAFAIDFRAPDRTLTDAEVDPVVAAIVGRLAEAFGADLRAS
jgi:phenylalanyl-tRNA synthetase beta chain